MTDFNPEKPYCMRFWHPIPTGYKLFSSYWWKDLIDFKKYVIFAETKLDRLNGNHTHSDIYEYSAINAYKQYKIFKDFRKYNLGHPDGISKAKYDEVLDKIILAWEAKIKMMDEYTYCREAFAEDQFNKELYDTWYADLDKQWKEGIRLYVKWYDSFWN